jgi:hypothetical protein
MVATDKRRWLSVDRLGAKPEAVLRRATRQTVEVAHLHTEPYRGDLGDLGALRRAISSGIRVLDPAAVIINGQGYSIIGGERRAAAMRANGAQFLTLHVIRTWQEFLAWMIQDERMAEGASHQGLSHRIDWPMGLVDAAYWTRKVLANLKTNNRDYADQAMAEHIGRDHARVRDVRYQLRWLDDPDEAIRSYAAAQLAEVQRGETSGSTIGGRITRFAESRRSMPVKQQRDILTAAAAQCAGLADALRPLAPALTPELTDAEIDSWVRHLSEGRLQAERVIRALKTIKKERSE